MIPALYTKDELGDHSAPLRNTPFNLLIVVENSRQTLNAAAYKFLPLDNLEVLREQLLERCQALALKGTILLSPEGINLMLAGKPQDVESLRELLNDDTRFTDLTWKDSYSEEVPFGQMVVKIKTEIISLGVPEINPHKHTATHLLPETLKAWLDEHRDIVLLDTRNDYEVRLGSFDNAIDLDIQRFRQFPDALSEIDGAIKDKPVVTFCTGGIRCEKAAELLLRQGFHEVYQIDGGILNYFEQCGDAHWHGDCFVYDDRITLDPQLNATHARLCRACQQPLPGNYQQAGDSGLCGKCANAASTQTQEDIA